MILWCVVRCGRGVGVWAARHTHTPTVLGVRNGAKNHLHSVTSPTTSSVEWKRKRRKRVRREWEDVWQVQQPLCLLHTGRIPHLDAPLSHPLSTKDGNGEEEEEEGVGDDEVGEMAGVVGEEEEEEEVGEFFDHPYHQHHKIQLQDIGTKVNVGEPVISELKRVYQISRQDALKIVRAKGFLLVADPSILQTLYFLKDHDIPAEQILRVPWILLHSADSLHHKFNKIQEPYLFLTPTHGLGFCYFSLSQINRYQQNFAKEAADFPNHPNRIYYLAEKFEVPVELLTEKVVKPKQIINMDMRRIEYLIGVFQKYGVQMSAVVSDMWVFCHNMRITEERLKVAMEAGCENLKPWICHSSEQVFERYIERWRSKRQVLGNEGDLCQYLSSRLQCSPQEITLAFQRNLGLSRMHVSRVKSKLDMLFSEGFTPAEVRSCMRVLLYAEERTHNRIRELKALGYFPFPIKVLYKGRRTYHNIVTKIKRKIKEEEEECKERKQDEE